MGGGGGGGRQQIIVQCTAVSTCNRARGDRIRDIRGTRNKGTVRESKGLEAKTSE